MLPGRRLKLRSRTGCARCRRRHQKCDERLPSCTRCIEAASECVYRDAKHHFSDAPPPVEPDPPTPPLQARSLGPIGLLSLLDDTQRSLLAYFIERASFAIACHDSIQFDTCRALIAAGSSSPCVLYTTLMFAAMHADMQPQALRLRSVALAKLRAELTEPNTEVVIAAALMMATCELRFSPETGTWRQHFEYTKSLGGARCESPLSRFISRRYIMMEFLVSLPMSWSAQKPSTMLLPDSLPPVDDLGTIDGTMACCTDLLEVFRWIGALKTTKCRSTASALVTVVHRMMKRDAKTPPVLSGLEGFADGLMTAYQMCNTIAGHVALICLYCYSLDMDGVSVPVKDSVDAIIQLAASMPKAKGSHPYICLTTALFVAGSEAVGENRVKVRRLLKTQHQVTQSRNTLRALDMLGKIWARPAYIRATADDSECILEDFVPY